MAYDRLLLLNRREFVTMVGTSAAAFSLAASEPSHALAASQASPAISLPPLPYAQNALAPYISENSVRTRIQVRLSERETMVGWGHIGATRERLAW